MALTIFKNGIKVEVVEKEGVNLGSWRPATIVSGNGHTYVVMSVCPAGAGVVTKKVPRKLLRPCPPTIEKTSWNVGDFVEVFVNEFWNLAELVRSLGWNFFAVRLVGSSMEIIARPFQLRVPQTWKDDHWIAFQKTSGYLQENVECKKVGGKSKTNGGNLNSQKHMSHVEVKRFEGEDRCAAKYEDGIFQKDQLSPGRTKKRQPICGAVDPPPKSRKKKEIKKQGGCYNLALKNLTSQQLEKLQGPNLEGLKACHMSDIVANGTLKCQ